MSQKTRITNFETSSKLNTQMSQPMIVSDADGAETRIKVCNALHRPSRFIGRAGLSSACLYFRVFRGFGFAHRYDSTFHFACRSTAWLVPESSSYQIVSNVLSSSSTVLG